MSEEERYHQCNYCQLNRETRENNASAHKPPVSASCWKALQAELAQKDKEIEKLKELARAVFLCMDCDARCDNWPTEEEIKDNGLGIFEIRHKESPCGLLEAVLKGEGK